MNDLRMLRVPSNGQRMVREAETKRQRRTLHALQATRKYTRGEQIMARTSIAADRQQNVAEWIWARSTGDMSYCVEPSRQIINGKIRSKLRMFKNADTHRQMVDRMAVLCIEATHSCDLASPVAASRTKASKAAQKGIDPAAQVEVERFNQGDVRVDDTKPGKGRVAGRRIRVVNALEAAADRGKLTARQLEASRKVEALVTRCSIGGGRGRDSCCMAEVGSGEQTDESAMNQAQAMQTLTQLCTMMDQETWLLTRAVCIGEKGIKDWRDTYRDCRTLKLGLDIAADFWKIPTSGGAR